MDYTTLTDDQKSEIIDGHIAMVEQQHFSATVQLARVRSTPDEIEVRGMIRDLERQRDALNGLREEDRAPV